MGACGVKKGWCRGAEVHHSARPPTGWAKMLIFPDAILQESRPEWKAKSATTCFCNSRDGLSRYESAQSTCMGVSAQPSKDFLTSF
eukprot:scaffold41435_cov15-Tisochrysis_lutea.AAC.1